MSKLMIDVADQEHRELEFIISYAFFLALLLLLVDKMFYKDNTKVNCPQINSERIFLELGFPKNSNLNIFAYY